MGEADSYGELPLRFNTSSGLQVFRASSFNVNIATEEQKLDGYGELAVFAQSEEIMRVRVKDLSAEIELKTKGMELGVRDNNNKHVGNLVVTQSKIIWCEGKTTRANGKVLSWDKFRKMMSSL